MSMKKLTEKNTLTRRVIGAVVGNLRAGVALMLIVLCIAASSAQAQKTKAKRAATKQDTDAAMLETLKAMQNELREIKELLAARPPQQQRQAANAPAAAPQTVSLDLSNRPFRGSKDAPVTIVEITDYECPFCVRHVQQTLPQIEKEYIATGKVKYYVVDLPLESIHRNAFKAAVAVRCANEEGKYWEMHDRLFAAQRGTLTDWNAHAVALGLDAEKFNGCVASDKYAGEVRKDIALTQKVGVSGTPGFFFATGGGATVTTSSFMNGARSFPAMKEQIDALLSQQQKQPQAAKPAPDKRRGGTER